MWTELTLDNASLNMDKVTSFITNQKSMSSFYGTKITSQYVYDMMARKQTRQLRVFFYDDGETQLNIVTKLTGDGRLRLLTTAIGNFKVMEDAVSIGHKKVIEIMKEYGVDYIFAIYDTNNEPVANEYYGLFGSGFGIKNGFSKSATTEDGKKLIWEATL